MIKFMPYANNKGADQSAHPHSLISAFVVRCPVSIIPLLPIAEIFKTLASLISWADQFESTLLANHTEGFSSDRAHWSPEANFGGIWLPFSHKNVCDRFIREGVFIRINTVIMFAFNWFIVISLLF